MPTLFENPAVENILQRINSLQPTNKAQWGKMDVAQALAHCCEPLKVALGDKTQPRTFMGLFFGKMAKKMVTGTEPFKKNLPTDKGFIITDTRDLATEKEHLTTLISRFNKSEPNILEARKHPFFGNMTADEWGWSMYKHLDHHLRQFGA